MSMLGYDLHSMIRRLREKYIQKFVFVHINKTGGSSIEKALGIRHEHKTAFEKKQALGNKLWRRKYSFAFVRNPWDKVVSHYHFRIMTNQTSLRDKPIEFSEWVQRAYGENDPIYYDNLKMFMPQLDWLSDKDGKLLVKDIGRFENLEEDFRKICRNINVANCSLPHAKKSNRGGYRKYYNDHTVEIVRKWFEKDIDYFGYRF